ncbi:hypothetical protein N2152v2_009122 [Parachlorella kessleri]
MEAQAGLGIPGGQVTGGGGLAADRDIATSAPHHVHAVLSAYGSNQLAWAHLVDRLPVVGAEQGAVGVDGAEEDWGGWVDRSPVVEAARAEKAARVVAAAGTVEAMVEERGVSAANPKQKAPCLTASTTVSAHLGGRPAARSVLQPEQQALGLAQLGEGRAAPEQVKACSGPSEVEHSPDGSA